MSKPKLKIKPKTGTTFRNTETQNSKISKFQNSKIPKFQNCTSQKPAGHHASGLSPGAVIQRARAHGARVGMVFRAAAA
jgi:hypothetical protein